MSPEQLGALLGVAAGLIGALALIVKSIADLVTAFRRKDDKPAPEIGIPASPPPVDDDIDYRAYQAMEKDRDWWRARALGLPEPDPDTPPLT